MELALDTSSVFASIALADKGNILAELTWSLGQSHTVELVPNIARLFTQAKVNKKDLEAVFVAKGPGSFNGLRVGLSVAKGIAFTLNIPLVGISTLEIAAYPFAFTKLLICPIQNAGRSEIATAFYQQKNSEWLCLEAERLTTVDDLCGKIKEETVFCGEISDPVIQQLQVELGEKAIIPSEETRLRRSSTAISLGLQRLQLGMKDNIANLQPLYLRPPPITMRKVK